MVLLFILLMLLVACSEKKIHKQIEQYLEASYHAEEEFIEYQEQLLQLEQRDLQLYDDIVQLDDAATKELQQLIGEALQVTEQRGAYLEAERKAMKQSQEEFSNLPTLIEEITTEEMNELLTKLYETMQERYNVYEEVYDTYMTSLQLTEILYEYLAENQSPNLFSTTINDINETYEELFQKNDQFNRLTKEYNRLKKEYYDLVRE